MQFDKIGEILDTFGQKCCETDCDEVIRTVGVSIFDVEENMILLPLCREHLIGFLDDIVWSRRMRGVAYIEGLEATNWKLDDDSGQLT